MILFRRDRKHALTTEITLGGRAVVLRFEAVQNAGIAVHVADDAPHAQELRTALLRLAPQGWEGFEDQEAPEIYALLTGGPVPLPRLGAPPRVQTAAVADVSTAPATDDLTARVASGELPAWAAGALRLGWTADDIGDYAQAEAAGRAACGLRPLEMMLVAPPSGWTRVERVWEVVGWTPPDGFVPPTVPPAVVPDAPPPVEAPDERFAAPEPEAPPEPDEVQNDTDDAADIDAADVARQLVALGAAEDEDIALRIITLAREVPPGSGAPAPRGKINIKMRNNKLPSLDEAAYDLIKPLLPIT